MKSLFPILLLAIFSLSLTASTAEWLNNSSDMDNPANWSEDPQSAKSIVIDGSSTKVTANSGFFHEYSSASKFYIQHQSEDENSGPTLEIKNNTSLVLPYATVFVGAAVGDSGNKDSVYNAGNIILESAQLQIGVEKALGQYGRDLVIASTDGRSQTYQAISTASFSATGSAKAPFSFINYSRGISLAYGLSSLGTLNLSGYGEFYLAGRAAIGFANGEAKINIHGSNLDIRFNDAGNSKEGLSMAAHNGGSATITFHFDRKGISPIHVNGDISFGKQCYLEVIMGKYNLSVGKSVPLIKATGKFTKFEKFVNFPDGMTFDEMGKTYEIIYSMTESTISVKRIR